MVAYANGWKHDHPIARQASILWVGLPIAEPLPLAEIPMARRTHPKSPNHRAAPRSDLAKMAIPSPPVMGTTKAAPLHFKN
jgi:hypothetical protein